MILASQYKVIKFVKLCYHKDNIMQGLDVVFYIAVLIMSVVIHEVSHGYAALYWGDQTARLAGRLTLNPLKHLDPIGSVIVPILMKLSTGFVFGWAKPVPYNPYNFRDQKRGTFWVASAGILANLFIAVIFGIISRFLPIATEVKINLFKSVISGQSIINISSNPIESAYGICLIIIFLNILLAVFNLVPIPPLDGSKILFSLLPLRSRNIQYFLERYSLFILLFFIFFLWKYLSAVIFYLFSLFTGIQFTGIGF